MLSMRLAQSARDAMWQKKKKKHSRNGVPRTRA
jgi:hypothetical protein